eukprot:CAMPEP_0195518564 /NCGR_PEP_ID=MMETSP0794_2-20130614/13160_1 /TAXON_ID=515487 /ORGANISM="Stephanopyxis turris, Strain CCMP 815" /LENGTH=429 /DNA_ID=CAMNT_0040647555 /DNA_START=68 /DNA_END=1357 /DNA_ORIENTATION=+
MPRIRRNIRRKSRLAVVLLSLAFACWSLTVILLKNSEIEHRLHQERRHRHLDEGSDNLETPKLTLFYCGRPWKLTQHSPEGVYIANRVFPEYEQTVRTATLLTNETVASATKDDLLVFQMHQYCEVDPIKFPGKVLYINGEYYDIHPNHRLNTDGDLTTNYLPNDSRSYVLGPHNDTDRSIRVTYMQMRTLYPRVKRELLFDPSKRPFNTKKHFLLYTSSHYVEYRERAADALSKIGVIHTGGKCEGNYKKSAWDQKGPVQCVPHDYNNTRIQPAPESSEFNGNVTFMHGSNERFFHNYRFGLILENINSPGYVSEKLLNAFLSGTVPIWYGSTEIFDIFNKKAFIYYNVENPKPALEYIAYLEENPEAYEKVLAQPILADGERTIEKYFSFSDDVGGGQLKKRIRQMMGYSVEPNHQTELPFNATTLS